MKRFVLLTGALIALAATDRWAARTSPPTGVSGWAAAAETAADSARAKLAELEEILSSKNDNDPRLDHDFNGLSPETKRLFRKKYGQIPVEKRNERGTIVYLLGRNLVAGEDWKFFRQVALEAPCLSLADCSKKPAPGSDEEATGDEVTLAYPSLVALRQARRVLEEARAPRAAAKSPPSGTAKTETEALNLFAAAKESKTRAVARMAALLEKKFAAP